MTADPGPSARPEFRWSAVLVPFLDEVAPPAPVRAARRIRNLAVLAAAMPWLLPRTSLLATGRTEDAARVSIAFGVAAVVAHVVRNRPWACVAGAGATVVAAFASAVPPPLWVLGFAGAAAATVVLAMFRRHVPEDAHHASTLPVVGHFAWVFVATLVFREFVVLPTHVPTGSMQPTIYGQRPHAQGDRVLVDRTAYIGRDPQRWEIAVFDYPLHRPTEFVKRVVALPGETVEVRDGDLWIDGRIARRPPLVQETMWREVFPRPHPTGVPKKFAEAWHSSDGWVVDGDALRVTGPGGSRHAVLKFKSSLAQGDLRVRFLPEFAGDEGDLAVRVRTRGHVVEAIAENASGLARHRLVVDDVEVGSGEGWPDEVSVADGLAILRREGVELVRGEVPTDGGRRHGIELAVSRGSVRVRHLRVDQDQRWLPARDGTSTWKVPAGHYFVLGDNAEQSEDSREWSVTEIALTGGGSPFRVAPSVPGETGAQEANLRQKDGALLFKDVEGVSYRVPLDRVAERRAGVRVPFVPRDHFLGRATFVFWPWAPSHDGGFRPRFLP